MDFEFEKRWREVVSQLENSFGEEIDLEAILFLIGVQELGKGVEKFSKDEKLNLMHIAICTVLEPFGYYEFSHLDKEGWPHFEKVKNLPFLSDKDQKELMRRAVVEYFEKEGLFMNPEQTF
ncbi:hypothetical protein O3Q51_02925 [Cryomorphaceae bacterium 1068]|nr:hypothetical protein [Cryomorphaceae bacterium 1068]